MPTHLNNIIYI